MEKKGKIEKVNLENLILNENAYFYKKEKDLTNSDIIRLFKNSRDDKKAKKRYKSYIKEPFFDENGKEIAKFSLDIFEYKTKPSFLKKDDSNLIEIKFGLFLIVETNEYLGLIRRNVSGIKSLKKFIADSSNEKPLIFIIDELDRCRPDYAVSILEQIKHFFSIPNIIFVLSINITNLYL